MKKREILVEGLKTSKAFSLFAALGVLLLLLLTNTTPALAEAPGQIDKTKRKVRTVGPTFLPH